MKRLIIFIVIFCSVLTARAQYGVGGGGGSTIVGRVSGTLVDSLTKKPLDYVAVAIYRSGGKTPLNGVLTDEKGNFKLDGIHPGNYKLIISYVGYPTKTVEPVTTTPSKPDKNLGEIFLKPSTRVLKEVTVAGQASLVETKIDKIVYNAEKDLTAAGGSATDVLQKVPLVSVDLNGNVSLRGDQNVRVLINGKPSGATSASLSDVLKGIPADQIKSIEVITTPSAKYDAEGSAGIINIITKQKNVSGISGSISGGVGTRQNNGNFNFNYNKNRFNLSVNMGGNAGWPQTSITDFYQKIGTGTDSINQSHGTSRLTRHAVIGSLSAGYEFNSYNSINSTFRANQIEFNTDGNTLTTGLKNYNSHTIAHAIPASGFDWNIDYTHKFKKEGEEITLSGQWTHSTGVTDYTNMYSAVLKNIKNNINGDNNEYTAQLDYTLPINKVFKLEAGGKSIFRRINSTNDVYTPSGGDFIYDAINSSTYNYNQNVYAGYTVLTVTLPKNYSILAGVRDENTDIHGIPQSLSQQTLSPFSQNYNTFVPSLTLQKQLTATQTLKLSYSKRITRPSLQYLNPFVNQSNILSQQKGNPELSPEISQTVELGYNTFIKSSILNFSVYYKHTNNLIESIVSPIMVNTVDANGNPTELPGTLSTYQNIGVNNSLGGSFFGSITPFKILTIMGNINAYTYKPDPSGVFHLAASSNGTYVQYGGFLRATLTLPKNWIAETFAFGNSARRTIQGEQSAFSIYGVGVRKQFMQKKLSLGVNAIQPFSNYKEFNSSLSSPRFVQTSRFQLPFRSFGLTFSYNFGKLTFSNPQQKKGINNDDIPPGDQGQGQGAPTGGSR